MKPIKLGNLFELGSWLADKDGDHLADGLNVSLIVPPELPADVHWAVNQLALRLGIEVTGLTLPICYATQEDPPPGNLRAVICPCPGKFPDGRNLPPSEPGRGIALIDGQDLLIFGDNEGLVNILWYLAALFPQLPVRGSSGQVEWITVSEAVDRIHAAGHTGHSTVEPSGLACDGKAVTLLFPRTLSDTLEIEIMSFELAMSGAAQKPGYEAVPRMSCLTQAFTVSGLLEDTDGDLLPDNIRAPLTPPGLSPQEQVSVTNLHARAGAETLGHRFWSLQTYRQTGACSFFSIQETQDDQATVALGDRGVIVTGSAHARAGAWDYLAKQFPETGIGVSWEEVLFHLEGIARRRGFQHDRNPQVTWIEPEVVWEVDQVRTFWLDLCRQNAVGPNPEIRVSEPLSVRQGLRRELLAIARDNQLAVTGLKVRCAYKQGLHWIMEEVIPALERHSSEIDRCVLEFAPFREKDALDPEARWLLEIYPADEVLAKTLSIDVDKISFAMNDCLSSTYRFAALSGDDKVIYTSEFAVWYSALPYIGCLGSTPTVHPATGGIRWKDKEKGFRHIHVPTDSERIMEVYHRVILPQARSLAQKLGLSQESQPFFETLEIEARLSEPEERLGIRQELISPADALHEDLYFIGLDMFSRLGAQHKTRLRAPGLILPTVVVTKGEPPRLRYRLLPKVTADAINSPVLKEIVLDGGRVTSSRLEWAVPSEEEARRIAGLLLAEAGSSGQCQETQLPTQMPVAMQAEVSFAYPGGYLKQLLPAGVFRNLPVLQRRTFAAKDSWAEESIVYQEECLTRLALLSAKPGVVCRLTGVSRQGRPIYSIAATSPGQGRIQVSAKHAGRKLTYMLNNRHHANEVSSTGAILNLMEELADESSGLRQVLTRVNVAAVPLENADGAALHQGLAQYNPEHKFHAARFNSQGREFVDSYFRPNPSVPEAGVLPALWRRWVPDIVVDNHGIPSHEWEQPFSGYLCPWFSSFWIPRSLFYGYFYYLNDDSHPSRQAAKGLESAVSGALVTEADVRHRNLELLKAWNKYFVPYLKDHFPGTQKDGMIWYYVPREPGDRGWSFSQRFPHLTVLDWTTEVADETAQGSYLELCVRTHFLAQKAGLQWLARQPIALERAVREESGGVYRAIARRRPLVPETL